MIRTLFLLLSVMLLFACQHRSERSDGEGSVRTSFNTDSLTTVVSKAAMASAPALAQFSFRVENTKKEILRTWGSLTDVPEVLNFAVGSYRFVAWNGSNEGLPAWDHSYWQGEYKFKIEAGKTTNAQVVIKMGLVQVTVTFDQATFSKYYSKFSADVRTTTPETPDAESLNFTPADGAKTGKFLPGTLRLRMRLTNKEDGKEYLFSPATPVGKAVAAEHYTIGLTMSETSGQATLRVTTNNEVTEIPIDINNLPSSTLPKSEPRVRSIGFDHTATPTAYSQGTAPSDKMSAAVEAPGGIKSLKLIATSSAMRAAWSGIETFELVGLSNELRRLLEATGFSWPASLNTLETALKTTARFDIRFDELFQKLGADPALDQAPTDYSFRLVAEDQFGQGSTSTSDFQATLRITPPIFGWTEPTAGNVWANRAEFELTGTTSFVGGEPFVEYRAVSDVAWRQGSYKSEQLTTPGTWRYTVQALTPNTAYLFRARMGAFTTAEFSQTTEPATQMPNSDMEAWQTKILIGGGLGTDIYHYTPYATNTTPFWTTNNDQTTSYDAWGVTSSYNRFPAVSYSVSAHLGKLAAEVRTVAAVGGNSGIVASGATAGLLFTGDNSTSGKPWLTRPAALEFYYTYKSYSNDRFDVKVEVYDAAGAVIGSGLLASPVGVTNSEYIKATVPITYPDAWPARAAKINVLFRSTNRGEPSVEKKVQLQLDFFDASGNNVGANKTWDAHTGSILRLDALNLVY